MTEFVPPEGTKVLDLSSECYRQYVYADDVSYIISAPKQLFILPNGSHRIIDSAGRTHRPTLGWLGLRWLPKDLEVPFVA